MYLLWGIWGHEHKYFFYGLWAIWAILILAEALTPHAKTPVSKEKEERGRQNEKSADDALRCLRVQYSTEVIWKQQYERQ